MEYRVENKKLYLAKKLLEYWNNRPDSVLFMDPINYRTENYLSTLVLINANKYLTYPYANEGQYGHQKKLYELMSIKAELVSHLFPGMTKKEVHESLEILEEEGVIKYRRLEEKPIEDYENIKFFNVSIDKPKLERFITIANRGLFGFNLSDKDTYNEVVAVIEVLQNSNELKIDFSDFHSENAFDILKGISNFSDAISITMKENDDYEVEMNEDDQPIITNGPEYLPESIIINDKTKIANILAYIEKTVNEIYIQGVDLFLEKYKILEWKCQKCPQTTHHLIEKCESALEITHWLDKFARGGYNTCHKCSTRNAFSISPIGEITYYIVPK